MNTPNKVEREEVWEQEYEKRFCEKQLLSDGSSSEYIHLKGSVLDRDLRDFIHQQLQKARQDWLREMEEVMRVDIGDASPTRLALQALLDRYHSELDHPTNPDTL